MTVSGDSTTTTSHPADTPPGPLDELSVRELIARLASRAPIPGGGSAAALAGSLAAALLSMVSALTEGRTSSDDDAQTVRQVAAAATASEAELTSLASLDASAYDTVVRARRLPRTTDAERAERTARVAAATRTATEVPLRTARAAMAVLALAERLVPAANPHAISDVGVAAHLATAAVRGAVLNVRINLPGLADDDPLKAARDELDELVAGAAAAEARLTAAVSHRLGG